MARTPSFLLAPGLARAARVLLCSAFLISCVLKLIDFPGAVAEVLGLTGFEPAAVFAALVIATQLCGWALVIAGGRLIWIGAALLAGFTMLATLAGHAFWAKTGVARVRDLMTFFEHMGEHMGLIGGFILAAIAARGGGGGERV